jgi:hypothetical protein
VRETDRGATSNVVFNYGHTTIPRHLRDIVITEYGIADLRSKCDSDIAKALIQIADSRFQAQLLEQAQRAGKIDAGWSVPERWRHNTPQRLEGLLQPFRTRGLFPALPFGSEFTAQELRLGKALKAVKQRAEATPKWKLLLDLWRFSDRAIPESARAALVQLGLDAPASLQDRVARMLLVDALRADGAA